MGDNVFAYTAHGCAVGDEHPDDIYMAVLYGEIQRPNSVVHPAFTRQMQRHDWCLIACACHVNCAFAGQYETKKRSPGCCFIIHERPRVKIGRYTIHVAVP